MEKEQYLSELKEALKETLDPKQTDDILADYSEFFDAGLAEGKSEEELCREFGSPEKAAEELKNNSVSQKVRWPIHLRLEFVFILSVAALFLYLPCLPFIDWNSPLYSFIYIFLMPLLLEAIINVAVARRSAAIPAYTSTLYRIRQKVFSGWGLIALLFVLSFILGNQCTWVNNHDIFYLVYASVVASISFICIVRGIYMVKSERFRLIKIILIACYPFIAALYVALFIIINMIDKQIINPLEPAICWFVILLTAIVILSIFSGILIAIYAIHKRPEAKWLIFLNTTFFTLALNIKWTLCHYDSGILENSFHTLESTILQNLIALVIFLLFLFICREIKAKGEKRYERANEKGRS